MNKPQIIITILLMIIGISVATAQNCRDDIIATTPDSGFTVHDNGTVTHNTTGLMWMRCSIGQSWSGSTCSGSAGGYSWKNALQAPDGFSYAGYSDWRLPNKNELESIVEERCSLPAINTVMFPNTPFNWFWSSSPKASHSRSALSVHFSHGFVGWDDNDSHNHVRLVRAVH